MQAKNFSRVDITLSQASIALLVERLKHSAYLYSSGSYNTKNDCADNLDNEDTDLHSNNGQTADKQCEQNNTGRFCIFTALPTQTLNDFDQFNALTGDADQSHCAQNTPRKDIATTSPTIYRQAKVGDKGSIHKQQSGNAPHSLGPEQSLLSLHSEPLPYSPPFTHGWIGAAGYNRDCFYAGFYTWSYIYDRKTKRGALYFSELCTSALRDYVIEAVHTAQQDAQVTNKGSKNQQDNHTPLRLGELAWQKSQSFDAYKTTFATLKDYIMAGDCYQANLTQRFESDSTLTTTDYIAAFMDAADESNANYCAFITLGANHHLISLSPEQFIECHHGQIRTKPIKGTVKSDGPLSPKQQGLLLSEKNKAENLMIVDLLRNDLSKVAELNTVKVEQLFAIQSFSNVHHLVSTISATLNQTYTPMDAFNAAFPGGSITGAPKQRAMEIIAELEQHDRRFYCGSVFYWDKQGGFDSSILIRTVEHIDNKVYCWGGGGIVADSECTSEYQESIDKVRHITGIDQ